MESNNTYNCTCTCTCGTDASTGGSNDIELIKEKLDSEINTGIVSNFFKVIGDETRLKILLVLSQNTLCVNDIAIILNMSKSAVSHQLRVLRNSRHVKSKKIGKNVYYSLDDNHVVEILKQAIVHTSHQ